MYYSETFEAPVDLAEWLNDRTTEALELGKVMKVISINTIGYSTARLFPILATIYIG